MYAHAIEEFTSAPQSVLDEHADLFVGFVPFCLVELGILHVRHGSVNDAIIAFDRALVTTTTELNAIPAPKDAFVTYDRSVDCATKERNTLRYRRWLCLQIEVKKHYAMALKAAGDLHSAGVLLCELMCLYRQGTFRSGLIYSDICFHLAEILNSQGKFTTAEPVIRDCVAHRRSLFLGPDNELAAIAAAAAASAPNPAAASAAAIAAVTGGAGCPPATVCDKTAKAAAKCLFALAADAAAASAASTADGAAGSDSSTAAGAGAAAAAAAPPLCEAGGACARIPLGDISIAAVASCAGEIGVERMNSRPGQTPSTLDELARASIAVGKAGAKQDKAGGSSACPAGAANVVTDAITAAAAAAAAADDTVDSEAVIDAASAAVIAADASCPGFDAPATCPGAAAAAASGCTSASANDTAANGPCPVAAAASSCFSFGSCPRSRACGPSAKPDPAAEGAAEVAVALCLLGTTIAAPEIGKYEEAEACLREAILLLDIACARGTSGVCDERSCMAALLSSVSAARAAAEARSATAATTTAATDAAADGGDAFSGQNSPAVGEGGAAADNTDAAVTFGRGAMTEDEQQAA